MQIDMALIKLVLLAIPGIAASLLYGKLTGKKNRKAWHDLFEIVVFSLFAYGLLGLTYGAVGLVLGRPVKVQFFAVLFAEEPQFTSWHEIAFASAIGIALSLVASLSYTRHWVNRLGYTLRVTKRSSDSDLWDSFNTDEDFRWVFVRDHKRDLVYFGWVQSFSESERERELILRDVNVYTNRQPAGKLYHLEALYLAREKDDITIEVPLAAEAGASMGVGAEDGQE